LADFAPKPNDSSCALWTGDESQFAEPGAFLQEQVVSATPVEGDSLALRGQ
jgi:hypothetical protein